MLGQALGQYPLGGLAASDSLSTLDPITGLISDLARREYLFRANPLDALNGVVLDPFGLMFFHPSVGSVIAVPTNSITLEAWIMVTGVSTFTVTDVMHVSNGSGVYRSLLVSALLKARFDVTNDAGIVFSSPAVSLAKNKWYHVAGVLDQAAMLVRLFLNGVEQGAGTAITGTFVTSLLGCSVGGDSWYGSETFQGRIAGDVRMWSTARTAAQIAANAGTHLVGNEAGLVECWPFNDAVGLLARSVTFYGANPTQHSLIAYNPGDRPLWDSSEPRAPVTTPVDLSSGGYISKSIDSPFKLFEPAISRPSDFSVQLPVPALSGAATTGIGSTRISNPDDNRDRDSYMDWLGVDIQLLLGKLDDSLGNFTVIQRGVANGVSRGSDDLNIVFRDARFRLQRPLQVNKYGGFGAAVRANGTSTTITGTLTPPAGNMTMEFRFRPMTLSLSIGDIAGWHASAAGDRAVEWNNASLGKLFFLARNDAAVSVLVASSATLVVGQAYFISYVLDATNLMLYVYINGVLDTSVSLPAGGTYNTVYSNFHMVSGLAFTNGDVDEFRLWNTARTQDQVQQAMIAPLQGIEPGLVYYAPMDEGSGGVTLPSVGSGTLTITNGAWVGTLEGGAELVGKPKPLAFGFRRQVAPVCVDTQNNVWQFHDGSMNAVSVMRDNGDPRWTSIGNVSDIYSSTPASGQFTTCLSMGLVRLGDAPTGIVTGDIQGDNGGALGYQNTAAPIARKILLQLCGWTDAQIDLSAFSALAAADAALAATVGQSIILVGYYWDGEMGRDAALNEVFASEWAWSVPNRTGSITCGRTPNPSTAAATVNLTEKDLVEPSKGGKWADDPMSVRVGEVRVLYRPYHTVLNDTQVAGIVSLANRKDFGQQYRITRSLNPSRTADADVMEVRTSIDNPAVAQALGDYILAILKSDRRVIKFALSNGILQYFIGTVINLVVSSIPDVTARGVTTRTYNLVVTRVAESYGDSTSPDRVEVDCFG